MEKLQTLMKAINYQFKNKSLLEESLRHRSAGKPHNERLEFLGDSILNFIIASELFKRLPAATEGELSRLRANLVNSDCLTDIAQAFNLSAIISLGDGERRSGGAMRSSILADTVEAIIGAIYLDSGMDVSYQTVVAWYQDRLESVSLEDVHKDPKSQLQELAQAQQFPLPEYELVSVTGVEHAQTFVVQCCVKLLDHSVIGEGTSRRRAEQDAAQHVLEELNNAK